MESAEIFSPSEISAVTGASVRSVYKAISERLPRGLSVQRNRQQYLTRWGAVCFVVDLEIPRDVPVAVRRQLYARVMEFPSGTELRYERGILSYVIDVQSVADRLDRDLARYRASMDLIVEDDEIQAGAATFRGTRILVHQIADLIAQGAAAAELQADYPRLTPDMIAAAPIFARAHPRRGRPRSPAWLSETSPVDAGQPSGA